MSDAINEYVGGPGRVLPRGQDYAELIRLLRNIRINGQLADYSSGGVDLRINLTPTPFLGWIDPDNANKIIIGADRAETWYPWLDSIYVQGTSLKLNKAAAETIAITEDCNVYYAIDVSAGPPITATLGVTTPVPADTATLRHVVLGYAEWDTDHVAWYKQQHFGNIILTPEYEDCECQARGDDYICLQDQKAQNTNGGTFTSGAWRTRDLTTEQSDEGGLCSLASNQFTLTCGDYVILALAPGMGVNNHQTRLYNATDAAVLITGQCAWNVGGPYAMTNSVIMGRFTIAAAKALEIQHRCATTAANTGFGTLFNITTEVYTVVQLWKVA